MLEDELIEGGLQDVVFLVFEVEFLAVACKLVIDVFLLLGFETRHHLRRQLTLIDIWIAVKGIEVSVQGRREILIRLRKRSILEIHLLRLRISTEIIDVKHRVLVV